MNEEERRTLVDRYLRELDRELEGVPAARRRELLEDLRGHIEEAWADSQDRTRAGLLNLLERLGDPRSLAREERERLGLPNPSDDRGPGLLEVAAVVFTIFFWPVGVLLAWLSPRWYGRDKLVATALPLLGLVLVITSSAVAYTTYSAAPVPVKSYQVAVSETSPSPAAAPTVEVDTPVRPVASQSPSTLATIRAIAVRSLVLFGLIGAPFTAGLYLALRLKPRPHRPALLLPIALGVMLVLGLVTSILTPA